MVLRLGGLYVDGTKEHARAANLVAVGVPAAEESARQPIGQVARPYPTPLCGEAQAPSKRISWAPSQRVISPSGRRFSFPSVTVRKWLPASCPALLSKRVPA